MFVSWFAAHFVAFIVAMDIVDSLRLSNAGPLWSVAEVSTLLEQAKSSLALCEPWLPKASHYKQELASVRGEVDSEIRRSRGRRELPTSGLLTVGVDVAPRLAKACTFCNLHTLHLLKCSQCKAASYCSKECQLKHWKSGHKQECKLAQSG